MRQSDHEYEERSFGDIQRAIDFENSIFLLPSKAAKTSMSVCLAN